MKPIIIFVQKQLYKLGHYSGSFDGIAGKLTSDALDKISEIPANWPVKRRIIGFIQYLCAKNNIDSGPLDGFLGPQTEYAFDVLKHFLKTGEKQKIWRPEDNHVKDIWPVQKYNDLVKKFGAPGNNQVMIELPYPHRLSWNKKKIIYRFSCNKEVKDSLEKVLIEVLEHYDIDGIRSLGLDLWGGCLNVRKMRGGTSYSAHSWGIAIDYNPEKNKLRWGADRAIFAKPEYDEWWNIWEQEGWISLGRQRNFDWMHVQAARLN